MENPEEVLQALDEFQKMRPSEIPRELEEYLCWVAKTGDPVYQWPLIKALFREKLTRVMTEFYESCPSIDSLASCPNVEHFNYDSMKNSLLERLETFANAPFTVQRICELLTTPRKEYNRVDKFMRAIEKNILVVSTREPGPTARRSENGDSLVNGSVEDEIPTGAQATDEIEMESWVKDCTPTTTLPLHSTTENESQLPASDVVQNSSVLKQLSSLNGSSEEKTEQQSAEADSNLASAFAVSTPDFLETASVDSTAAVQEQPTNIVQAPTLMHETSSSSSSGSSGNSSSNSIVGEVPEAMMNEDTSSQPSLDLEGDDSETGEPTRKLQTTFQAKDFLPSNSPKSNPYDKEQDPEEAEEKVPEVIENHVSEVSNSTKSESDESVSTATMDFGALANDTRVKVAEEAEAPAEKRNFAEIGNGDNGKIIEKKIENSIKSPEIATEMQQEETKGDDTVKDLEDSPMKEKEEPKAAEVDSEEVPQVQETPKDESTTTEEIAADEEPKKESERTDSVIEVTGVTENPVRGKKRSADKIEEPPAKIMSLESSTCTMENGQRVSEKPIDEETETPSEPIEQENSVNVDSS